MTMIQQESFSGIYHELLPLFREHWHDLGPYKDRMPLSPNLELYAYLEGANQLVTITARQDRRLIGYLIAAVKSGLHYSTTVQAITDIPYVLPSVKTRGIVMMMLFRRAEEEFRARGVGPWFASLKIGSRHDEPMDRLLRGFGMMPCDRQYSKWIV